MTSLNFTDFKISAGDFDEHEDEDWLWVIQAASLGEGSNEGWGSCPGCVRGSV